MEQFRINSAITNGNVINYYVSSSGVDDGSNNGLSAAAPFATISHALAVAVTQPLKYDINIILVSDIVESSGISINNIGRKITIKSDSVSPRRKVTAATQIENFIFDDSTNIVTFVTDSIPTFGIMVNGRIIPLTTNDPDTLRKPYEMMRYSIVDYNTESQIMKFTTEDELPEITSETFFQFIFDFNCCSSRIASVDDNVYTLADRIVEPRTHGGSRFRIFNSPDYLDDNTYYYVNNGDDTYTVTCKLDSSLSAIDSVYVFDSRNVFNIQSSFGITIKDIEVYGNIGHSFGYLTLQAGLPFTDWSPTKDYYNAILIQNSSNITVTNTFFTKTYDYAVRVDNSSDIYINKNRFYELYCGGIDVTFESYNVYIESNIVNGYGRFNTEFVGIIVRRVHHCTVVHNTICDGYYTGISVGWSFNYDDHTNSNLKIANNHIHHIGQFQGADGGGIYIMGKVNDSYIEHNKIHDVYNWYKTQNNLFGIYCEAGLAYATIRFNIIYSCDMFVVSSDNYNVSLFNNVFAYPGKDKALLFNGKYDYEKTILIAHNIFLTNKADLFVGDNTATFHRNFVSGENEPAFRKIVDDNNVFGDNPFVDSAHADFSFAMTEDNGFTFGSDLRYKSLDFDTLNITSTGISGGYGCLEPSMAQYLTLPDIDNMDYNAYYRAIAESQGIEHAFIG